MIRRLSISRPATLTTLSLTAIITGITLIGAGCSTFTDNNAAAKVDGRKLTVDQLNALAEDLLVGDEGEGLTALGELAGTDVRSLVTVWVQSAAQLAELDRRGLVIDDAARAAAAAGFESGGPEWATFSPATQAVLIDYTAAPAVLFDDPAVLPEESIKAAYESGVAASNAMCLRVMLFATEEAAASVKADLDAGVSFADLADEHPLDPAAEPNGGIFADPQTGGECVAAEGLPDVATALASTPIGESSAPLQIGASFYLILQRPYDEVTADVRAVIVPALVQPILDGLLAEADVSIDSRYGMWDAETATVVPTR